MIYKMADLTGINTAHTSNIDNIVTKTGQYAKDNIENSTANPESSLQDLADKYYNDLIAAGNAVANANDSKASMIAAARKQGWFLAGTWVTQIIMAQGKINSALNSKADWEAQGNPPPAEISDTVAVYDESGSAAINEQGKRNAEERETSKDIKTSSSDPNQTTGFSGSGKVAQVMAAWVTEIDLKEIKNDTRHPLLIMQNIGEGIINAIFTALGTVIALSVFTSLVSTAPVVAIFITLAMPIAAFIGVGAMLAYILPNLPFLIWIGIIIGWTIMVVEAVIAAPLWAVMHLHPNGDDLTGKGGNGYMLLLGLLLRPVLIVFGLIAAIVLSGLFGQLINRVFFDIFTSSMGSGGLGFFATIFGTAIYASLMMVVLKQTFNLMHVIPDQLMRWIGGGGEQLGQYAGGFSGEGMAKAGAIGGAAAGFIAKDVAGAGANALGQARQAKAADNTTKSINSQKDQDRSLAETKAAQDKSSDQTNSNNEFNDKIGTSDDIAGKINDDKSAGSLGAVKAQNQVSSTNTALGGNGSEAAETYKSELSNNMKPESQGGMGQSFDEAHSNALSTAADQKWGEGSSQAVNQLSAEGQPMNKILSSLNAKQNSIQENTGNSLETQSKMSSMFSRANEMMGSNASDAGPVKPPSSFGQAISNASKEINNSLDTPSSSATVSAPVAPPKKVDS